MSPIERKRASSSASACMSLSDWHRMAKRREVMNQAHRTQRTKLGRERQSAFEGVSISPSVCLSLSLSLSLCLFPSLFPSISLSRNIKERVGTHALGLGTDRR